MDINEHRFLIGCPCETCGKNTVRRSGHKNIGYDKRNNLWIFTKMIKGKKYRKNFRKKEEALAYKFIFTLKMKSEIYLLSGYRNAYSFVETE